MSEEEREMGWLHKTPNPIVWNFFSYVYRPSILFYVHTIPYSLQKETKNLWNN